MTASKQNTMTQVTLQEAEKLSLGTIHLRRRHVLGGRGGSPLPMFADARGGGVLGLPTSAIFEIIRDKFQFLIDYIIRINTGKFLIILYYTNKKNSFCFICKNCI